MKQFSLEHIEMIFIYMSLKQNLWNRTLAAKELDISERNIRYKIKKYRKMGLKIPNNPSNERKTKVKKMVLRRSRAT